MPTIEVRQLTPAAPVAPPEQAASPGLYGVLVVAGITVAIDVEAIREVVPRPSRLVPFPSVRDDVPGAVELRGTIIPVLDFGRVLGARGESEGDGVIAILRDRGQVVGVLVDSIIGIARLTAQAIGALDHTGGLAQAPLACATFLHQGMRGVVVQVVLLRQLAGLPMVIDAIEDHIAQHRANARQTCLVCRLGETAIALAAGAVVATVPESAIIRAPVDNDLWLGLMAYNGSLLPAIDTRRVAGLGALPTRPARSGAVVVRVGEIGRIALVIDAVDSIRRLPPVDERGLAQIGVTGDGATHGLADIDGRLVLLLNAAAMSHDPRLTEIAKMDKPDPAAGAGALAIPGGPSGREGATRLGADAWLTFVIGRARFALALGHVEAVMLGEQPHIPLAGQGQIAAVLMYRGQPVPLFDLAGSLGVVRDHDPADSILIMVEHQGDRRAFLADALCSVERVALQNLRTSDTARLARATIRARDAITYQVLGPEAFQLA